MGTNRTAKIERVTSESNITVELDLDHSKSSNGNIKTTVPFLDHMLQQIPRHSLIGLGVDARGDVHIDDHHTVEDVGICIGKALNQALGDKRGIFRYGSAYAPLDESLTRVVLDFSGRPGLFFNIKFTRVRVGNFDADLVREFFMGLVNHAQLTLHIDGIHGQNAHHQIESLFKAFALALRRAVALDPQQTAIPSSKGML